MSEGVGLVAVVDLLNTLDQRTFLRLGTVHQAEDRLTTVESLSGWFADHDLPTSASPADLDATRAVRDGLRDALLTTTGLTEPVEDRTPPEPVEGPRRGRRPDPSAGVLHAFPVRLHPVDGGLQLVADTGSEGLDAIVEAVATAVADGRWKRLKLCASEDCRWAYLDTSRSGGGRWCSMETCGNRHKTRAYRQRRAG